MQGEERVAINGDIDDIKEIRETDSEIEHTPGSGREYKNSSLLQEQEEKVVVLVNNPANDESPQRIDFSGLKADDDDPNSA